MVLTVTSPPNSIARDLVNPDNPDFEVAYADDELHFKEQHLIKQIAGILNIENQDLIKTKLEIKKYL